MQRQRINRFLRSATIAGRLFWLSKTPMERFDAMQINRQIIYDMIHLPPGFKDFLKLLNEHAEGIEI